MHTFRDYYKNLVTLSFEDHPFSEQPKHILVICEYNGEWLLTKHSDRGLEFPGGKVEPGETAKQAAVREVHEETGGIVNAIQYIGQYVVEGKAETVFKNVYYATITRLETQSTYFETEGPVLRKELPKDMKVDQNFSFIMKDEIVPRSIEQITRTIKSI
ncbi:8-oxo-dGTP diphosphatase [Lentibacillus sp. JNUCC-1]|uniref:RNA deprotection pyrophosphohydrolase n=1 Tax=Lentibacillus sp. JNUCC-1 TaxID=2654513 RepID=UPI0012E7C794|nr:nucleoside triphosphatase YtkD [Lentibacillus sp. JNUCC-1]MUV39255.1 8-oxo-dGTP diphosphatase [Lentibacillus sp. JNUCC-1]